MNDPNPPSRNYHNPEKNNSSGWSRALVRIFRDNKVLILFVLGVTSIILGTTGFTKYFSQTNDSKSFATALYNALWLFTIEAGNLREPIPWELEVARWLSPMVAMYAVLLGFAVIFRDQVKLLGLSFLRNHVIICGLGDTGMNLARSFRENDFAVAVIEKDSNNPHIAGCRELGAVVLTGDATDKYFLCKAGVKKAAYLVAVCGDDGVNSDIALTARRIVQDRKNGKLNCAIQIKDPGLWTVVRAQEFLTKSDLNFRLHIFNLYDQGAKQLFREFPVNGKSPLDCSPPKLIIIGAGDFSEQIILNAARQWVPCFDSTNQPVQISLLDPNAKAFARCITNSYSLVSEICEIHCTEIDPGFITPSDMDFQNQNEQWDNTYIFLLVENESISLRLALSILEKLRPRSPRILVRMKEEKGLANLIRESNRDKRLFENLKLFGLMEKTCKKEMIFNSSLEAISRAIHEEYVRKEAEKGNLPGSSPILVDWNRLPEDIKEMNREQADGIAEKLSAVGCGIMPWYEFEAEKFSFTPAEIEMLAGLEHQRWMEQKLRQGWVYGETRDDRLKKHPSLVPYTDSRLSESEKDKDRNTVTEIPRFLALAGYQIYRA